MSSTISDMKLKYEIEWDKIQGTQEKENIELLENLFKVLNLLYHVSAGLNILGIFISSSLLYGVIREKQHFLSPSLYFAPIDLILTSLLMIIQLDLKISEIDPIKNIVAYLFTVILLNITWLLTILYKQQIQKQTEKEKLM